MGDQEAFLLSPLPPPSPHERYYDRGYERLVMRNSRAVSVRSAREEELFRGEFADVDGTDTLALFLLI